MPLADYERVIRVNLIGTFNTMRLAAAAMAPLDPLTDGERGVIVCTASVAAFDGNCAPLRHRRAASSAWSCPRRASSPSSECALTPSPRDISDADAARALAAGAGQPRGLAAVSEEARRSVAIRCAGEAHDRKPLPQRRSRPARCGAAHGAALNSTPKSVPTSATYASDGNCRPAGIIFYPRYFEIFDTCTTVLIERALGMNKIDYLKASTSPAIRSSRHERASASRRGSATRWRSRRRSWNAADRASSSSTGSPRPARSRSKASRRACR